MMKNKKVVPYVAGVLMIVLFGVGLWSMKSGTGMKKSDDSAQQADTVKRHFKQGSYSIALANPSETLQVGRPVKLIVSADSATKSVTDYDIVVAYNSLAFKIDSVTSLISDFNVAPFENDSVLSVTGFKTIGSAGDSMFAGTGIVELTVTPISTGVNTFGILEKSSNASSKFIDSNGEVYYPEVGSVSVTVNK